MVHEGGKDREEIAVEPIRSSHKMERLGEEHEVLPVRSILEFLCQTPEAINKVENLLDPLS